MTSEQGIYISFNPQIYREGKKDVLSSQAIILNNFKHINNLKVFSKQKNDLKKKLYRLLSTTLSELDSIKEKIPVPIIPKEVKKKLPKESQKLKEKKLDSRYNSIDDELRQIQEKLRLLNAI